MARVIKEIPIVEKQIVCRNGCGATIAYVPNEVRSYHGKDISGGPDGREWIVCPGCGKDITIKSW